MNFFSKATAVLAITSALVFIGLLWLSQPLEVYEMSTGTCLYQLEVASLGFGEERQVPCGTYGELAVQRVAEIMM